MNVAAGIGFDAPVPRRYRSNTTLSHGRILFEILLKVSPEGVYLALHECLDRVVIVTRHFGCPKEVLRLFAVAK